MVCVNNDKMERKEKKWDDFATIRSSYRRMATVKGNGAAIDSITKFDFLGNMVKRFENRVFYFFFLVTHLVVRHRRLLSLFITIHQS